MDTTLILPFILATLTFAVMPGPGVIYCVARTVAHGTRAGLMAAFGVHVGGYAHVLAAGFGLAVLFHAVPVLFTTMKLFGAGYLIWIGVTFLRARLTDMPRDLPHADKGSFRQSVLVEVLNPKTALFYLAFLPQFVSAEAVLSVPAQLVILGIIVNIVFSASDVAYAMAAGGLRTALTRSRKLVTWSQRAGGALLVGLGLNLALSRST